MSTWQKLGTSVDVTVTASHSISMSQTQTQCGCDMLMLILGTCWTTFVFMSMFKSHRPQLKTKIIRYTFEKKIVKLFWVFSDKERRGGWNPQNILLIQLPSFCQWMIHSLSESAMFWDKLQLKFPVSIVQKCHISHVSIPHNDKFPTFISSHSRPL